ASAPGAGPAAVASGAISCVLTPELTEGPYYVPAEKVRRNITEGKPGAPLDLRLTVVDASTCKPIKSAVVDIWHADAIGVYSGAVAGSPGTNFMRGIQKTDSVGLARFTSVYPGWYQGRAVHIHVKAHLGATRCRKGRCEGITAAGAHRLPTHRRARPGRVGRRGRRPVCSASRPDRHVRGRS